MWFLCPSQYQIISQLEADESQGTVHRELYGIQFTS